MTRRFERLWRQVGTGISFALFGIGGLAMAVLVFPLVNSIFRDRSRRAEFAQHMVHRAWRLFVRTMVVLRVIDFQTIGGDILRAEAGTLVIANHPSLIDVVLIMSLMDRTQCVVKPGVWKNPFMRGVVHATNYIPNAGDSQKTIEECVTALKAGNNLLIFPEGSRTESDGAKRLQRGFAAIALRAQAPVRIVFVTCTPPTLRKGEKWYQSPASRPLFLVRVCEKLSPESFAGCGIPSRAARTLTNRVARRFEELNCNG